MTGRVLVYQRAPTLTCDVCGEPIDGEPHTPHNVLCPKVDRPRWCAKSREGWCAVVPNTEPAEGSWSVATICEQGITLPWGYDHRIPDCPDCLAATNDCDCDWVTHPQCCWTCRNTP